MHTIQFSTIISAHLAADMCSASSDPFQIILIVGLVVASGVFVFSAGVSAISVAIVLVQMIVAGATIPEITAAIGAITTGGIEGSAGAVTSLVVAIRQILGCCSTET